MKEYVIYSETEGIYLGSFWGLGFWSNLDPVGQDCATTFESVAQAQEHINSWDESPKFEYFFVEVNVKNNGYATRDELKRSHLPIWRLEGE